MAPGQLARTHPTVTHAHTHARTHAHCTHTRARARSLWTSDGWPTLHVRPHLASTGRLAPHGLGPLIRHGSPALSLATSRHVPIPRLWAHRRQLAPAPQTGQALLDSDLECRKSDSLVPQASTASGPTPRVVCKADPHRLSAAALRPGQTRSTRIARCPSVTSSPSLRAHAQAAEPVLVCEADPRAQHLTRFRHKMQPPPVSDTL
jgi:hypothetical protein